MARETSEARGLLAPVYDWFAKGFDNADLKGTNPFFMVRDWARPKHDKDAASPFETINCD
jgi:hypothetical protein